MKITSFLSKAQIRNFMEMIKHKMTGFKHSHLPTGILQKTTMEEPEKVPDWLMTGITYLLPNL
jgi:hypothetical protein